MKYLYSALYSVTIWLPYFRDVLVGYYGRAAQVFGNPAAKVLCDPRSHRF